MKRNNFYFASLIALAVIHPALADTAGSYSFHKGDVLIRARALGVLPDENVSLSIGGGAKARFSAASAYVVEREIYEKAGGS